MTEKNLSLSLILAIALGFSACGGGGDSTPQVAPSGEEVNTTKTDTQEPIFGDNIRTTFTIVEGSVQDVTTITVTDENPVSFELEGEDKDFFKLDNVKDNSATLKFKNLPDYEVQPSYKVIVKATDSFNNSAEKAFTIYLADKAFAFDTTGNMGSVETGKNKQLILSTVEAKGDVKYKLIEGDNSLFDLDEEKGILTFHAPVLSVNKEENKYSALIEASDTERTIQLPITVQVIAVGGQPSLISYLLKEKEEREILVDNVLSTVYSYEYDQDNYLVKIEKSGTNIYNKEVITFEYEDDHKIMRGYAGGGQLDTIRVFADKNTFKLKFPAMLHTRLSSSDYIAYMNYVSDTAEFNKNRHLIKYIYGLKSHQTIAEQYVYNSDDTLSRVMVGNYDMQYEKLISLDIPKLEKEYAPTGGFPDGSVGLSEVQRREILSNSIMPYYISHETTYTYENGQLKKRNFFNYATGTSDSSSISVKYFNDGVINMISTDGITITYRNDSLLDSINNYKYTYQASERTVDVAIRNGNSIVATYKFEEE